jgi:hypothetical protein
MTRSALGVLATLVVVAVVYLALGLGYHRQSSACFDSRHASDGDRGALTGTPALVMDAVLWPLFLAFTPPDISCEPLDVE